MVTSCLKDCNIENINSDESNREVKDFIRISKDVKIANSPRTFLIIFIIGCFLIFLWCFRLFRNDKYNTLSFLLGLWMIIWGLSLVDIKYEHMRLNFHIQLPEFINCIIPLERCEDGGFELVTIFHFIGYMLVGLIVPDLYIEIILISIGFEIFESLIGFTPKVILDPTINFLGYSFGSWMHHSANEK